MTLRSLMSVSHTSCRESHFNKILGQISQSKDHSTLLTWVKTYAAANVLEQHVVDAQKKVVTWAPPQNNHAVPSTARQEFLGGVAVDPSIFDADVATYAADVASAW